MNTAPLTPEPLTPERFAEGLEHLAAHDARLRGVLDRHGPPPLWTREPGFAALVLIILEQQVSLASAQAALARLRQVVGAVTPETLLAAGEEVVRAAGVTRQKSAYLQGLARAVHDGQLDLNALPRQPDDTVRAALTTLRGIGDWTADVYLLLALQRPDVLPVGDLGLILSAQRAYELPERPTRTQLLDLGEGWRPWRSVATRLLWHAYLTERGRSFPP